MKQIVEGAKIIDKSSPFNGEIVNLLIDGNFIKKISKARIEDSDIPVFNAKGMYISQGWTDVGVHFKDPGYEWIEDLNSISEAAKYGGFTHLIGHPNTKPVVQTKEGMAYFKNFSKDKSVQFHNFSAVTLNCAGDDFTDMIDLAASGALGFSDGREAIQNSDIFLKTLLYLEPLHSVLVVKSKDKYLSMYGQMHEGVTSTLLGLKGIPSAGEELMIMRNLKLLEYSGVKSDTAILHFSTISTRGSVDLIREAKKQGLPVSCDIAAHHLEFTEEDLMGFNTNFKVYPPFRTREDIKALEKGLEDGTIDLIVSDHDAWDEEHKNLEFDMAEFGLVGLQTVFPVALKHLNLELSLEKMVYNPRKIFKIAETPVVEGGIADFTVFDPEAKFLADDNTLKSRTKNTPFLGKWLTGKAKAICSNNIFEILD